MCATNSAILPPQQGDYLEPSNAPTYNINEAH